jgi:hypothetical protein
VVAILAVSGVAQAGTIISETLTGTITGGFDSGANGANDDADIFGGGNLYGATAPMEVNTYCCLAPMNIIGISPTMDPLPLASPLVP